MTPNRVYDFPPQFQHPFRTPPDSTVQNNSGKRIYTLRFYDRVDMGVTKTELEEIAEVAKELSSKQKWGCPYRYKKRAKESCKMLLGSEVEALNHIRNTHPRAKLKPMQVIITDPPWAVTRKRH